MADMAVRVTVNGKGREVVGDGKRLLLEVLREEWGLTGTKYGCGEGQCGACLVLVGGEPAFACMTTIESVEGKEVTTIEGLEKEGKLHPVQEAFLAEGAFQCGYCTPGMVLGTVALLAKTPKPSDEQILSALNGHLCRCCGYAKIVAAVKQASTK